MNKHTNERGFIRLIIIIVIAILVLSYFGYNIRTIANSPTAKDNFSYVTEVVLNVWNNYLKVPAGYIWQFFIDFIWGPAFKAIQTKQYTTPVVPQALQAITRILG